MKVQPQLRAVARLALLTGPTGVVVALVATGVALSTDSATAGVVTRTGLVTLLLVLMTRAVAREVRDQGFERWVLPVAGGLAAGYALDLAWWGGHAYAAQLLFGDALVRFVVDAVLWVGVGLVGAVTSGRSTPAVRPT